MPKRARDLPTDVWAAGRRRPDVVVHAGDWVDGRRCSTVCERTPPPGWSASTATTTHGVLRQRLPEVARERLVEGVRFAVVHETGSAAGREAAVQRDGFRTSTC